MNKIMGEVIPLNRIALDVVYVNAKTNTGELLVDLSESGRKRPWAEKKVMSLKVAALYKKAMGKEELLTNERYKSLLQCGNSLLFGEQDGKKKLVKANFCRIRLCPMCNWRKSLKMFGQVSRISEELLKEKLAVRFLFLTLTVKNVIGERLKETMDLMNKAFQYLFSENRTFAPAAVIKKNLLGYLRAMEVTYNSKSGEYHPHLHILLAVKPAYFSRDYVAQSRWREIWRKAMKLDYEPMVNIKAIKKVSTKVIAEVAKYPTKVEDITKLEDEEQAIGVLTTLHNALKSRRLVTFGGCFREIQRKLKLDDVESGDLVHIDTEMKLSLNFVGYALYSYRAEIGAYIC